MFILALRDAFFQVALSIPDVAVCVKGECLVIRLRSAAMLPTAILRCFI